MGPVSYIQVYIIQDLLDTPYMLLPHHEKILKFPSDSGYASSDAPNTHTL